LPVWLNITRVSESGDDLLVESFPLGTLPKGATADSVVVQLYRRGLLIREFRLGELLSEQQSVQKAIAVGAWGKALGSERSEIARYLLSDGRVVRVSLPDARAEYE
jgi:hypothetical protein